jgi:integrase
MTIQKLPAPESGQRFYRDDTLIGFGLRVSAKSKTFVLILGKERQYITIGRYPVVTLAQAREKARTILAERQLGIVQKPTPTLKAVKAEYLARRDGEVRLATRQGDTYLFKPFDNLMNLKLADIDPSHIEAVIDSIEAPSTRRSAYIRISGFFSYAVRKGYLDRSPVKALEAPPDQAPRYRVLTDVELRKVLAVTHVLRLAGDQYGTIVELLIYTGQRRNQIAALARSMVDFDTDTITWPPELMKTGKRHVIPLGSAVRALLEPRDVTSLYFPSRVGAPFCGWTYHFRKLTQEVGFADWVLHDLRRTLATRWQEMGIEIATTEKMLSHSAITGGLVGIYQRSTYLLQMRAAVQKWEEYLQALLSKSESTNAEQHPSGNRSLHYTSA